LIKIRNSNRYMRNDGVFDHVPALAPIEIEAFADRYLTPSMVANDGF
jgi:hypothetical protein